MNASNYIPPKTALLFLSFLVQNTHKPLNQIHQEPEDIKLKRGYMAKYTLPKNVSTFYIEVLQLLIQEIMDITSGSINKILKL